MAHGSRADAAALGLQESEIGFGAHRPSLFSAGVTFPMAPIATRAAVDRAKLSVDALSRIVGGSDGGQIFIYCAEPVGAGHHYYARMFAPAFGIAEDPATGSAVASFAGAIMAFERPGDGAHRFVVEQGYAMGRPSEIELTLHVEAGALQRAEIGGSAVVGVEPLGSGGQFATRCLSLFGDGLVDGFEFVDVTGAHGCSFGRSGRGAFE